MDPATAFEWAQYGVLGLVIVAILAGWLVPGRHYDRAVQRADRLEAENRELRDRIENKVVPLVHDAITALARRER